MEVQPTNCWRIVIEGARMRQQHQVHQQASALLLLDFWIRKALEEALAPVKISLFSYDAEGNERLLVEANLPSAHSSEGL